MTKIASRGSCLKFFNLNSAFSCFFALNVRPVLEAPKAVNITASRGNSTLASVSWSHRISETNFTVRWTHAPQLKKYVLQTALCSPVPLCSVTAFRGNWSISQVQQINASCLSKQFAGLNQTATDRKPVQILNVSVWKENGEDECKGANTRTATHDIGRLMIGQPYIIDVSEVVCHQYELFLSLSLSLSLSLLNQLY